MTLAARGSCHKASRSDFLVLIVSLYLIQWVAAVNAHFEIIDNTERDNEVKKLKRDYSLYKSNKFEFFRVAK